MKTVNNNAFKPSNTLSNGQPLPFLRTSLPPQEAKAPVSPAKPEWKSSKPSVSLAPQGLLGQSHAPKPTWQAPAPAPAQAPAPAAAPAPAKPVSGPVSSTADFAPRPKLERTPRPMGPAETFQVQDGKLTSVSDNNNVKLHTFKREENGYLNSVNENKNAKPHTFKREENGYLNSVNENKNVKPHTFKREENGYLNSVNENNNVKPHTFKREEDGYLKGLD